MKVINVLFIYTIKLFKIFSKKNISFILVSISSLSLKTKKKKIINIDGAKLTQFKKIYN